MKRKNMDFNNSMDKSNEDSEENYKKPKHKKNKKKKYETEPNDNNNNILDEIKKEEQKKREKILEEVNNTMIENNNKSDNKSNKKKKNKAKKEKEKTESKKDESKIDESKNDESKEEEDEKEEEIKENEKLKIKEKKEKEKIKKEEKEKEKEKIKTNKQKKKKNNIISNTLDEIDNELNEQNFLEIENIFEVNKKFNYPKTSPIFYLRSDDTNNDLFPYPLSTNEIKDLLKKKEIKPFLIKIKPIDIFIMKNYEPFHYFDFNEILAKNWSKNLEYSSIFLNEYNNYYEKNKKKDFENKNQKLEISSNFSEYFMYDKKPKFNKKVEKVEKVEKIEKIEKNEIQESKNDITLNLNFSAIDKKGYNDFSMSIIRQLEGVPLTKKKLEKITSIIEEVEEDEWKEIKTKKKEVEKKPFIGIVGLNESKQIDPEEIPKNKNKNKKKKGGNNRKKQAVNFNNKFAAFKIDHGSDEDEEDEK